MGLTGYQKILFTQREGVQKFWPGIIHKIVLKDGFHGFPITGNALYHAVRLLASQGGIKQDQFSHAGHPVMAADNRHYFRGMRRYGPRVKHGIRPIGIAAIVFHLAGAVRVHVKQDARREVGNVGIFPTEIQHPAVGQHAGAPIMVLLEG
ncbi:MAG: hypothetical protein BWX80_02012 [Candidatus Hydrogenedentes bacterium ADurb.Bin101]|nr:MAG: hypothetical protein BWX80_02012 [Candidatus Hydrogenedentes bacterium ADurb.Bin101]